MGERVLIETKFDLEDSARVKVRRVSAHRWHAVTIAAPENACAAAQACKGKRFLSGDAPSLPLGKCDAKQCQCRYSHYDDRRGDSRRQDRKGAEQQGRDQSNRRQSRGRRASD
jgi:hypothetical protein